MTSTAEPATRDTSPRDALRALRRLLERPELRARIMASETAADAARELGLPAELIADVQRVLIAAGSAEDTTGPEGIADDDPMSGRALGAIDDTRRFLETSFAQLSRAYLLSLAMSIAVFVVGLAFLVIAAANAIARPGNPEASAVIGGLGLIQLVAVFYRSPLREVARAVSNAQKARMAVMSYMLGVALVGEEVYHGRPTGAAARKLERLTTNAVAAFERIDAAASGGDEGDPAEPSAD